MKCPMHITTPPMPNIPNQCTQWCSHCVNYRPEPENKNTSHNNYTNHIKQIKVKAIKPLKKPVESTSTKSELSFVTREVIENIPYNTDGDGHYLLFATDRYIDEKHQVTDVPIILQLTYDEYSQYHHLRYDMKNLLAAIKYLLDHRPPASFVSKVEVKAEDYAKDHPEPSSDFSITFPSTEHIGFKAKKENTETNTTEEEYTKRIKQCKQYKQDYDLCLQRFEQRADRLINNGITYEPLPRKENKFSITPIEVITLISLFALILTIIFF